MRRLPIHLTKAKDPETMTLNPPIVPIPMVLGGKTIGDSAQTIINYFENTRTRNTIQNFDYVAFINRKNFAAGLSPRITQSTITAANWLNAAFSRGFPGNPLTAWFAPQEATARWTLLTPAHTFMASDPNICNGFYDDMCEIWSHFVPVIATGKKIGIGETQVNKVLHQLYPDLFPIFDSKLNDLYQPFKTSCRSKVRAIRNRSCPDNRWNLDGFGWEPFRLDMLREQHKFAALRQQVATLPCRNQSQIASMPMQLWASRNLSDVRLMDIVAWS